MKQPFIFAMLAAAWIGAGPAQAQNFAADLLPPYEVATIVTSMDMRPLDRPIWRNGRYVVHAIDRNGREVRVVLDARDGQVIAVRPRMRDDVAEPRYAPPPGYPGAAPYDPRYDQRYGRPPSPPAAVPGRQPADDDDEFFDDDRQQGSLMPPSSPQRGDPAQRELPTGNVQRRVTSNAPLTSNKDPVQKDGANKDVTPLPRSRPALASASVEQPKVGPPENSGGTQAIAPPADKKPADQKAGKPAAKQSASAGAGTADAAKPTEAQKKDVRVIDLSKPKSEQKVEDKPGEAIRY